MAEANDQESFVTSMASSNGSDVPIIPEMTSSKDSAASNFSQVIFPDISDYFPPGKDVTVAYVLTEALQPSSRDWIGLFQVGWTSPREYQTFVWAPKISSDHANDRTVRATFSAYYLPTDKNEFYQFCYVTRQGHVRGASTPFQFRNQMECDQLVEVEDENGMIVLKTKTAAMEEQLDKVTTQKVKLEAKLADLNKEKADLESELNGVKSELKSVKEAGEQQEKKCQGLEATVKDLTEKLEKVTSEIQAANVKITKQKQELDNAAFAIAKLTKETLGMKEKLEKATEHHEKEMASLNGQLDSKTEKLTEAECTVVDLTEKLKKKDMETNDLQQKAVTVTSEVAQSVTNLTKERDEAQTRAQRFKDEKDLFKDQFTHSEEARRDVMQQLTELRRKMTLKDEEVKQKGEKILACEERTKILKKELREAVKQCSSQKSTMESQLSNVEDQLNACEASKRLIASELTEARDCRDKLMSELNLVKKEKDVMSRDLAAAERQRSELEKNYFTLKERAERDERRNKEKDGKLAEEKERARLKEEELREQITILHTQLESADMAVATATSAEQNKTECSTQTKSSKTKAAHASSQTKEDLKAKDRVIDDLKTQIEDLRTRLSMGAAAYTEKYMECHKLEKKMKKIQGQKPGQKVVASVQKSAAPDSTTSDSQDDIAQKSASTKGSGAKAKKGSEASEATKKTKPAEATDESSGGGNFMSRLEQLFMAIADPDAEEQEHANQLRAKLEELEKNVQFQSSKYRKYKILYQEEKKSRMVDCEKAAEELASVKLELEKLRKTNEDLHNENEALKDQVSEFVKNSHDENVIKTLKILDPAVMAPGEPSIGCRYRNPYKEEETPTRGEDGVKPILKLLYGNPYKKDATIIERGDNSSDSDVSGDFQLANSRFPGLGGLCPKNRSSDDSDAIEIVRPPVDTLPSSTVINRQPIRSPPLIEVISDETTSDDVSSSPPSYEDDAVTNAYNNRNSAPAATPEKPTGTRRRRTGKGKKTKSRKSYA